DAVDLALDFNINAWPAVSVALSQLDSRLATPATLLNDDFISVPPVAAHRYVRLVHAVLRACRSHASLVANFSGTSGAGQHARAGQDGCQDQHMASSHRVAPFSFHLIATPAAKCCSRNRRALRRKLNTVWNNQPFV